MLLFVACLCSVAAASRADMPKSSRLMIHVSNKATGKKGECVVDHNKTSQIGFSCVLFYRKAQSHRANTSTV